MEHHGTQLQCLRRYIIVLPGNCQRYRLRIGSMGHFNKVDPWFFSHQVLHLVSSDVIPFFSIAVGNPWVYHAVASCPWNMEWNTHVLCHESWSTKKCCILNQTLNCHSVWKITLWSKKLGKNSWNQRQETEAKGAHGTREAAAVSAVRLLWRFCHPRGLELFWNPGIYMDSWGWKSWKWRICSREWFWHVLTRRIQSFAKFRGKRNIVGIELWRRQPTCQRSSWPVWHVQKKKKKLEVFLRWGWMFPCIAKHEFALKYAAQELL